MIYFKNELVFQWYIEKNLLNEKKSDFGYFTASKNKYFLKGSAKVYIDLAEILADLQKWELLYILKEALPGVNKPPIFKGYIFHETKYKNRLETYGALDFDITVHKMLSINQACDLLNISRPTIYKLIGEGKLETVNFFGQKRIQMKTILQLIQDHISK